MIKITDEDNLIIQEADEEKTKCLICEFMMTQRELNISQRLTTYTQERGQKIRIHNKVRQKL